MLLCAALGFYHMQSAHDRDDYVTINWANMLPRSKPNFVKYPSYVVSHFGTTYDYDSVMHYSASAFSNNGEPTIMPKVSDTIKICNKITFKSQICSRTSRNWRRSDNANG